MRDTEREERHRQRRSRLHARTPMRDSILGLQDHALSMKAGVQPLSLPGVPQGVCVNAVVWGRKPDVSVLLWPLTHPPRDMQEECTQRVHTVHSRADLGNIEHKRTSTAHACPDLMKDLP